MTLDEPISKDLIEEVILMIFKNIKETPKLVIEKGSNVGEGYLGITSRVRVEIGQDVKHLFIKMVPENEKLRKVLLLNKVFKREVDFYSEIYPIFNEICIKYTKKYFDITPRCLLTKKDYLKEAIAFENVTIYGYAIKNDVYDKEHMMMILKTYSRFHAYGFVLKYEYPKKFHEMIPKQTGRGIIFDIFGIYDMNNVSLFGIDILKKHCLVSEDEIILSKLDKIKSMILDVETYMNNPDEYSTILQIDCWKNNLMFKYEKDSNKLKDLKVVDMQMWTINSPIFDLLHIIYTNINGNETQELLDFYIDFYYESLSQEILKLGKDPHIIYPQEIYLSHLKKYSFYGFYLATIILRCLLVNDKDVPNLAELIMNDKPLTEAFMYNLADEEDYSQRLKVVLNHLIKNEII